MGATKLVTVLKRDYVISAKVAKREPTQMNESLHTSMEAGNKGTSGYF